MARNTFHRKKIDGGRRAQWATPRRLVFTRSKKYYHDMEGYNGRLDSLQAGFLSVKLQHLAEWNRQRQEAASRYNEMLSPVDGVVAPYQPSWSRPVHHLYVVRVADRDGLQKHLAEAKIDTGIHYPIPLHMQKAYETFGF